MPLLKGTRAPFCSLETHEGGVEFAEELRVRIGEVGSERRSLGFGCLRLEKREGDGPAKASLAEAVVTAAASDSGAGKREVGVVTRRNKEAGGAE